MRDHTPNFKMLELSEESKILIRDTVIQLIDKLVADGQLAPEARLEFWVEVPGIRHPRGTFRGGWLMPDSYLCISDWFSSNGSVYSPAEQYTTSDRPIEEAWDDLLDELYYQIEIFTSQKSDSRGITVELWAGTRQRPEGDWIYAVDRKIELV